MTRRATDAFVYMYAVIEKDEVRKVMHSGPFDRLSSTEALAYWCEVRTVDKQLRMTIHARAYWRDACERGGFDGRMTIATVDPVITRVVFVAELDGLLPLDKCASVIRRPLDLRQDPRGAAKDKDGAKYAHLRKGVSTAMENLRHSSSLSCSLNKSRALDEQNKRSRPFGVGP